MAKQHLQYGNVRSKIYNARQFMVVFVTYGNSFYQKAINAKSQGDLFDLLLTVKLQNKADS